MQLILNFPVPSVIDREVSLETVDLDEDESQLEAFLEEASPLPFDDQTISFPHSKNEKDSPPIEDISRDQSMYFTPDATFPEKLNEV
jgi:hypothetical protein